MLVTKEQLIRRMEDGRWNQVSPNVFRWFGNDPLYEIQFRQYGDWYPATEPHMRPNTKCRIRRREPARRISPFTVKWYVGEDRPSLKGNGFDGLEIGKTREEAEAFVKWLNDRLYELVQYREEEQDSS